MRIVIFFLTSTCFLFSHFANAFYIEDLGNSWSKHEKFGTFYDAKQTGWYYHLSHGWIYVHDWNDEGTWFYIPLTNKSLTPENDNTSERKVAFGWSWSQPQFYPMLYNNHLKAWLYYNKERNKSKFYYYPLKTYILPDLILEIEEIELGEVARDSKLKVKSSGGRTINFPPRTEPATPQGGRTINIPPRTEPATL